MKKTIITSLALIAFMFCSAQTVVKMKMPPQAKENGGKLVPAQIDVLTAYVWSLSNKPSTAN